MAGIIDFLFEGKPPPSVNTFGTVTNSLPQWYSDYLQGTIAGAHRVIQQPYTPYKGDRVANTPQATKDAWAGAQANQGAWKPAFAEAGANLSTAATQSASGAANPYLQRAGAMSASAATNGTYGDAAGLARAGGTVNPLAAGAGALSTAQGMVGTAAGMNPLQAAQANFNSASNFANQGGNANVVGAAQPGLNGALNYAQQAAGNSASGAASGAFSQAGQNLPGRIGDYMNPYMSQVVNRAGELGLRNLRENLLPAVGDQFIKSGQFGSSRYQGEVGGKLRDTVGEIAAAQNKLMYDGYNLAGQQFQADANRQLQLGQAQGALANQDNATALQAGNLSADVGKTMGSLTDAQADNALQAGNLQADLGSKTGALVDAQTKNLLTGANISQSIGQTQGQLADAYADNQISASGALTSLANGQANTINTEQRNQGALGELAGNFSSIDTNNLIKTAGAQQNLGSAASAAGYTDAAALEAVGGAQQAQAQRELDIKYQNFADQRDHNMNDIKFMSSILAQSPQPPTSSQTTDTKPLSGATYGPSGIGQIAQGLSLAKGFSELFKAEGGMVRKGDKTPAHKRAPVKRGRQIGKPKGALNQAKEMC